MDCKIGAFALSNDTVIALHRLRSLEDTTAQVDCKDNCVDDQPTLRYNKAMGLKNRREDRMARKMSISVLSLLLAGWILGALQGYCQAVHPLVQESRGYVRWSMVTALGNQGDTTALPLIRSALRDSEPGVRRRAALSLARLGDRTAVVLLVDALGDVEWSVRASAAYALGKLGDPSAVQALGQALMDTRWEVRSSAAAALGQIGDRSAAPLLGTALKDPHWFVRWEARKASLNLEKEGGSLEE